MSTTFSLIWDQAEKTVDELIDNRFQPIKLHRIGFLILAFLATVTLIWWKLMSIVLGLGAILVLIALVIRKRREQNYLRRINPLYVTQTRIAIPNKEAREPETVVVSKQAHALLSAPKYARYHPRQVSLRKTGLRYRHRIKPIKGASQLADGMFRWEFILHPELKPVELDDPRVFLNIDERWKDQKVGPYYFVIPKEARTEDLLRQYSRLPQVRRSWRAYLLQIFTVEELRYLFFQGGISPLDVLLLIHWEHSREEILDWVA
jgi:hypothetical protein